MIPLFSHFQNNKQLLLQKTHTALSKEQTGERHVENRPP